MKSLTLKLITVLCLMISTPASAQPFCFCIKCVTGGYKSYYIPQGAMKPTLVPNQCIVARLHPEPDDITRGQIISYKHPTTEFVYVSRIIGIGGDTVQMREGQVILNDSAVQRRSVEPYRETMERQGDAGHLPRCANAPVALGDACMKEQFSEILNGVQFRTLSLGDYPVDNTPIYDVPTGHVFVISDNRDNAVDSRMPVASRGVGFVPVKNIIGIVENVAD